MAFSGAEARCQGWLWSGICNFHGYAVRILERQDGYEVQFPQRQAGQFPQCENGYGVEKKKKKVVE